MEKQMKILASVLGALCLAFIVATAVLGGFLASSQSEIDSLKDDKELLEERVVNVGKVACLMEGYSLSQKARIAECNSIVEFLVEQKTDDELRDLLRKTEIYPYEYRS